MPGVLLFLPFLLIRFGLLAAKTGRPCPPGGPLCPHAGEGRRSPTPSTNWPPWGSSWPCAPAASRVAAPGTWHGGLVLYLLGLVLCAVSVLHFAAPDQDGLNTQGIYRLSRNPMYLGYFVCFLGMALLTRSWVPLALVLVFQGSAHWIILAEERWCQETFGEAYRQYRGG